MSVRREIAEYDGIFFTTLTHAIVSVKQVYIGGGFAGAAGSGNDNIPAAFLNLIMFSNDLLTSAELPMAAVPITAGAFTKQKITVGPFDIPAPGYVYIYVNDNSNSPNWVHFDDLKITHVHSPFVSGADYYPFGLTMSDREILTEPYRFGYQGQYAEEETETGWNSFDLRMYDARFGRWLSPDPYGQYASGYVGMGNNPASGVDPDGGFNLGSTAVGALAGFGVGAAIGLGIDLLNDGKINDGYWWKGGLMGAFAGGVAGASAGDIGNGPFENGFQKFRAEAKFAIQGPNDGVWNSIKIKNGVINFGAGERTSTSVKKLIWQDSHFWIGDKLFRREPRMAILNGLNRKSKHII